MGQKAHFHNILCDRGQKIGASSLYFEYVRGCGRVVGKYFISCLSYLKLYFKSQEQYGFEKSIPKTFVALCVG
jgi:hypothetical protein